MSSYLHQTVFNLFLSFVHLFKSFATFLIYIFIKCLINILQLSWSEICHTYKYGTHLYYIFKWNIFGMWKLLIFIHSLFFLHKVLLSLWVSLVYQFNLILSKNNNHIVITVILQISFLNLFPQLKLLKHYWIKVETLVDLIWFPKGLPGWLSWYIICMQCGRPEFDPRVGKIPGRREQLPTPVFWSGEFHGLYSSWVPI